MALLLPPDLTTADAALYFGGAHSRQNRPTAVTRFNAGKAVALTLDDAIWVTEQGDDILGGHACHDFEAVKVVDRKLYIVCMVVHDGINHEHFKHQTIYGFALQAQVMRTLETRDEGRDLVRSLMETKAPSWDDFQW